MIRLCHKSIRPARLYPNHRHIEPAGDVQQPLKVSERQLAIVIASGREAAAIPSQCRYGEIKPLCNGSDFLNPKKARFRGQMRLATGDFESVKADRLHDLHALLNAIVDECAAKCGK